MKENLEQIVDTAKEELIHEHQSLGNRLIEARQQANYSIERVAAATRISIQFIHALESDELEKLPGAVFARGFIRSLCKLYAIDQEPLLAEYQQVANLTADPDDLQPNGRSEATGQGVRLRRYNQKSPVNKILQIALNPSQYFRRTPLVLILASFTSFLLISYILLFSPTTTQKTSTKPAAKIIVTAGNKSIQVEPKISSSKLAQEMRKLEKTEKTSQALPERAKPNNDLATGRAQDQISENKGKTVSVKSSSKKVKNSGTPGQMVAYGNQSNKRQQIHVTVVEPTKIKLLVDAGAWRHQRLDKGKYIFEFRNKALLNVENPNTILVSFNGKLLQPAKAKQALPVKKYSFYKSRKIQEEGKKSF